MKGKQQATHTTVFSVLAQRTSYAMKVKQQTINKVTFLIVGGRV